MLTFSLQTAALLIAGALLFLAWRATQGHGRLVGAALTAGLLLRAVLGQLLFWISYLEAPILEGLQLGDGFWFFAIDGASYFQQAVAAGDEGILAIVSLSRSSASVSFVQVLSLATVLLGKVASVGILLNLFSYILAALLIVKFGKLLRPDHPAVLIPVMAVSFSPAAILWSLQPLKDTFFQLTVIIFIGAAILWHRSWLITDRKNSRVGAAAILVASMFLVAGIRWYFAAALLAACSIFLLLVALAAGTRRGWAIGSSLLLFLFLTQSFVFSAYPYVPAPIRDALTLERGATSLSAGWIAENIENTREGFDRTGGDTIISPGESVTRIERWDGFQKRASEAIPSKEMGQPVERREAGRGVSSPVAGSSPGNRDGLTATNGSAHEDRAGSLRLDPEVSPGPQESRDAGQLEVTRLEEVGDAAAATTGTGTYSPVEKLVAGVVATVIPRTVAQRLGLVSIGGGKGLWLFAELDTLFFDLIAISALIWVVSRMRAFSPLNPLFWLVAVTTVLVAVPLVYAVTNFGTLFRLRGIVLTGIAMLPFAIALARATTEANESIPHLDGRDANHPDQESIL
jgi:hypothetical protein